MEFRIKDILKNILPGMIILFSILLYVDHTYNEIDLSDIFTSDLKDYSEIFLLIILVFCYLLGYLNDGVSSLLEYLIYRLVGFPSLKLLSGKGKRIFLTQPDEIINNIRSSLSLDEVVVNITNGNYWNRNLKTRQLFKYANVLKSNNPNNQVHKRIEEFYLSYVFSRNILFAFSIALIFLFQSYGHYFTTRDYIFIAVVFIALLIRRRDKSYYYSREVFLASKFEKKNECDLHSQRIKCLLVNKRRMIM